MVVVEEQPKPLLSQINLANGERFTGCRAVAKLNSGSTLTQSEHREEDGPE
jgi:hypothetical protein